MDYVLNQEEYDELKNGIEKEREAVKETLQRLCAEVAIYKPIKFWNNAIPSPWGCWQNGGSSIGGYCDECPVQDDCPEEYKRWSK